MVLDTYESRKRKKKRKRTVISPEEVDRLEVLFKQEPLPDRLTKMELAREMGKSETFVNIWFQNRRARERKMKSGGANRETAVKTVEKGNQSDPVMPQALDLRVKNGESSSMSTAQTECVVQSPLFGRMIRMAAAAEEGILSLDSPYHSQAMTDAWKGIQLADARVFYHKVYGFDVENKTY